MSEEQLPIHALISSRCSELGLRPVEVVRRCGYKNLSKGFGDLKTSAEVTSRAPTRSFAAYLMRLRCQWTWSRKPLRIHSGSFEKPRRLHGVKRSDHMPSF